MVRDKIWQENPEVQLFDSALFDSACIGIWTNNKLDRAVYSYEKMIECLMIKKGFSHLGAIDYLEQLEITTDDGEGPIVIRQIAD